MQKYFLFLLLLSSWLTLSAGWGQDRQDQVLADGWKFIQDDVSPDASTDSWLSVTIPHTWNTKEADEAGQKTDPHYKSGYYRGTCWYERALDIPSTLQGRRIFIRFEAASLVSKTYVNGQLLGEHRGGFTAFCYELTPYLHFGGKNELRVQVDNSHQEDVAPLSGDFNVDGGIYRPVHLIITDPVCVTPLEMASPGVFLTMKSLTNQVAQVEVKALISNGNTSSADVQVKTVVSDAVGNMVQSNTSSAAPIPSGKTLPILTTLNINSPHLWNGRKDAYLYTVTVSVLKGGKVTDSIQQPLGLRTVAISEEKGFLLNGDPYPIYGVNRHQDWGDQGWAASAANDIEDMQMILDLGTTAIRLTHYPQSDSWHNLCDHNGLLLWNEVPLVNEVHDTPEFQANAEQQLRELILQRYNHPSVAFWGLFNELSLRKTDDPTPLIGHLKAVVQELDPSRLIVSAIAIAHKPYNTIPDHPCFNRYPGWYNKFGQLENQIKGGCQEVGKRIALSEYGAGANINQHDEGPVLQQPKPGGPYHPEEWQTHVHEDDWSVIQGNPQLWGSFIWVMFDFQVASRHEGNQINLNDKGLVTQDRKTKKDAYYFYQANWTTQPMIHLASQRMTPRRLAETEVQVFSNCPKVELFVNGTSQGTQEPDKIHVVRWPGVKLQLGKNEIKAVAESLSGPLSDGCEWTLDPDSTAFLPPPNAFNNPSPKP